MADLLIVVDYQNDFVSGALGFSGAEALEMPICRKMDEYIARGDDIIFTLDTHGSGYLETQEGKNLPVEHCIAGSEGHKPYGRIAEYMEKGITFFKPTFGSSALMHHLLERSYRRIELVGLVSNICVLSNAVICKAAQPEAEIVVDAACTASFDLSLHEKAMDVLEGIQVKVTNRGCASD